MVDYVTVLTPASSHYPLDTLLEYIGLNTVIVLYCTVIVLYCTVIVLYSYSPITGSWTVMTLLMMEPSDFRIVERSLMENTQTECLNRIFLFKTNSTALYYTVQYFSNINKITS